MFLFPTTFFAWVFLLCSTFVSRINVRFYLKSCISLVRTDGGPQEHTERVTVLEARCFDARENLLIDADYHRN